MKVQHVLYNNRWLLPIQGYPQLPALRYCQIFFFSTVSNENKVHSMWAERGVEKKKALIDWWISNSIFFHITVQITCLKKKTNKRQLYLLKVKSTEIVIKSCRWDKVSCVRNKATKYRRSVTHPGGTPYISLYGEAPLERGTFFRLKVYERVKG